MSLSTQIIYEFGSFQLDVAQKCLLQNGQPVKITPKALAVLALLVEKRGQIVNRDDLQKTIWPDAPLDEPTIRQNILSIRKILENESNSQPYIQTFPKVGYCFIAEVRVLEAENSASPDSPFFRNGWSRVKRQKSQTGFSTPARRSGVAVQETAGKSADPSPVQIFAHRRSTLAHHAEAEQTEAAKSLVAQMPSVWQRPGLFKAKRTFWLLAMVLIILAAGAAFMLFDSWKSSASVFLNRDALRIVTIEKWKCEPDDAGSQARFSPDGKLIALTMVKNDQTDIYIKPVSGGEPRQVTNDPAHESSPMWSPDGSEIAYLADAGGKSAVYSCPFIGGTSKFICGLPAEKPLRLVRWANDSTKIYYEARGNLFLLHLDSMQSDPLTNLDWSTSNAQDFCVSFDEKKVAYRAKINNQYDIFSQTFREANPVQITNDAASDRSPCWLPDNKTLLYNSNRDGIFQTFLVSVDNPVPVQVMSLADENFLTDVYAKTGKILYASSMADSDIWRVNLETGEEAQITDSPEMELWQEVSPDMKQLIYQKVGSVGHIWESSLILKNLDNPSAEATMTLTQGFDAQWSPDGSKLAYLQKVEGQVNLRVISRAGDNEKQMATDVMPPSLSRLPCNKGFMQGYAWSPDGHQLAYCSRKSGSWNIYIVADDGTTETNITSNTEPLNWSCFSPLWSPDGKKIAYQMTRRTENNKSLSSIVVYDGQKPEIVFEKQSLLTLLGWSADGKDLIAVEEEMMSSFTNASLFKIFAKGQPVKLKNIYADNIKLSPDRKSIAYVIREAGLETVKAMNLETLETKTVIQNRDKNTFYANLIWTADGKTLYYTRQKRNNLVAMIENSK